MTTKLVPLALLGLMLAFAPFATASGGNETPEEGENAWVEDCPPDQMCAYQDPSSEEPAKDANATGDEATYRGDCGGEVCAYQDPNRPVSSDEGSTCMDGAQEGETCQEDVQYMAPPASDANEEAAPISAPADESGATNEVPGLTGASLVVGAAAALGALAILRRR